MSQLLRRVQASLSRQVLALSPTLPVCRSPPTIRPPVCCPAPASERRFHSMPTHGIGRWKHLLRKRVHRKKKERHQMKPVAAATHTAYGTLNVTVSGYDMTLVERYAQFVHHLCNRLSVRVSQCYALPTKTTEVMLMQDQGTKMYVDAVLKTHERVVQLHRLSTVSCPVFMDVLLQHQPEGVQLCVQEHTEEHYRARFKARPDLQELMNNLKY